MDDLISYEKDDDDNLGLGVPPKGKHIFGMVKVNSDNERDRSLLTKPTDFIGVVFLKILRTEKARKLAAITGL